MWLKDPDAWKTGTFMPNFYIPDEGIEALTSYLHSLQGQQNEAAQEWEFGVNLFLNNKPPRQGDLVWKRFGCRGCHRDNAVGGLKNPNAAPSEEMPNLLDAAIKFSEEEMRVLLSGRQVPDLLNTDESTPPFFCPDYGDAISDREFKVLYAYLQNLAPKKSRFRFKPLH